MTLSLWLKSNIWPIIMPVIMIAFWVFLKDIVGIKDRFLPHPIEIFEILTTNFNNIWYHFLLSIGRVIASFSISIIIGITTASLMYRTAFIHNILMPIIQSVRAVPATATLPFFILWFGFSEEGRMLVMVLSISTNISVAAYQIYTNMPDKFLIAYSSFGISRNKIKWKDLWFYAIESLLPTLRFSLTVLMGVSVVAELLGAQTGLGYLIQAARTSYALDVLLTCIVLFGVITMLLDKILVITWSKLIPWKNNIIQNN